MTINKDIYFDEKKFKQVLHYIISKVGTLDNVGKTVLYKMLYFSDFDYYELCNKSITGENYFKLPNGPAPSHFKNNVEELKKNDKIKEISGKYGGYSQIKFISLCPPELNLLNGKEIQRIDMVICKLSGMSANQISSYSHEDIPWKATEEKEEIDYELVFYRSPTFSVIENVEVC